MKLARLFRAVPRVVSLLWTAQRLLGVKKLCYFIGSGRSGTTLAGALLNAHPKIIIVNEYNLFSRLRGAAGALARWREYDAALRRNREDNANGLVNTGYDYSVPGGHQSRTVYPRVFGDKKAVESAQPFRKFGPEQFEVWGRQDWPACFIHMIRNPYDAITTMYSRNNPRSYTFRDLTWRTPRPEIPGGADDPMRELLDRTAREQGENRILLQSIMHFFARAEGVMLLQKHGTPELINVHYCRLVESLRTELPRIITRLGLECDEAYLAMCERIVKPPSRTRTRLAELWTDDVRALVDAQIRRFDFYEGYGWDADNPANPPAN